MVNDTTTLNGALTELGETLAANLVTKGVSGASANDGLTTLAGKILDIPAGEELLLHDTCTVNNSELYPPLQIDSRDVVPGILYNSGYNNYRLTSTKDCFTGFQLYPKHKYIDVSIEFKMSGTSAFQQCLLGFFNGTESTLIRAMGNKKVGILNRTYNGSESYPGGNDYINSSYFNNEFWRLRITSESLIPRYSFENLDGTELYYYQETNTVSSSNKIFFGFLSGSNRDIYVRNIKINTSLRD